MKRRENRRAYLDASIVPVEQALLYRAWELDNHALTMAQDADRTADHDGKPLDVLMPVAIAAEFRKLAEELHWW